MGGSGLYFGHAEFEMPNRYPMEMSSRQLWRKVGVELYVPLAYGE